MSTGCISVFVIVGLQPWMLPLSFVTGAVSLRPLIFYHVAALTVRLQNHLHPAGPTHSATGRHDEDSFVLLGLRREPATRCETHLRRLTVDLFQGFGNARLTMDTMSLPTHRLQIIPAV
jgi:hypothetical protein